MDRIEKLGLTILMLAVIISCWLITTPNQSKQIIILRDSLNTAIKQILYYRTQYLKANTQLIEIKTKCIYCAE